MGNSSTPGTQTMTNWPAVAMRGSLNLIDLTAGVSFRWSETVKTLSPTVMRHPRHLAQLRIPEFIHEILNLSAYLAEHLGPFFPDGRPNLDRFCAGHQVFDRLTACRYPSNTDHRYADGFIDLVDTSHTNRSYC